jgi:hypothetical protein
VYCKLCNEPLGYIKVPLVGGGYVHRGCAASARYHARCDLASLVAMSIIAGVLGGAPIAFGLLFVGCLLHYAAHTTWWRQP